MDKLDITTSHNIVVTTELANVTQRALATCIDGIIIGLYVFLASVISGGSTAISTILILPVMLCYHLIFEYLNEGQSLGKRFLKIKVISLSGDRPTLMELVMRWMFRLLDITFSLGLIAAIFISSTKKKQRIGDILSNTAVVRTENDNFISLSSIKNISEASYEAKFPQVVRYNDQDMLLVKQALTRYKKRPTDANKQLIIELHNKITKDFKINERKGDKLEFLRTLLNDYVVLTR